MKRSTTATVLVLLGLFLLAMAPFLSGRRALYPFHTGSLEPFSATAPDWSTKDESPCNFVVGDKHTIIHPDHVVTRDALRAGRVPLWNPYNFAGLPHAANPLTAVWYPPNWIFSLIDPIDAFAWVNALHLVLIAWFGFLFLRAIDVSRPLAHLGGLALAMSGWVMVHVHHNYFVHAFTWLPLGLFAIERFLRDGKRIHLVLAAIAVAFSFLAGFPQTGVINAWMFLIWSLFASISKAKRDGLRSATRSAGLLAAFATLGLLIAAIQLAPTLEFMSRAGHQDLRLEHMKGDALRPGALLTLLSPEILGTAHDHRSPGDEFFALWALTDESHPFGHLTNNASERTFFCGSMLLLAALFALFVRRDRPMLVLWCSAIISVALALGTRLLDAFVHLPGFDFGSPMRFTQVAAFAIPMLGCAAIDRFLETVERRRGSLRVTVGAATVLVLAPFAAALVALWLGPNWTLEKFSGWMQNSGLARRLGAGAMSREEIVNGLLEAYFRIRVVLSIVFAAWLGITVWLARAASGQANRIALIVAAFLLVLPELGWYGARFNQPVRREGLYATHCPSLDFLRSHIANDRMVRFDGGAGMPLFLPNVAQAFGIRDAQGFRALAPADYLDLMRNVEPNALDIGFPNLAKTDSLFRPELGLLRIRYVASPGPIDARGWKQVFPPEGYVGTPGMWIFENPVVLPRAFFADRVVSLRREEALKEIASKSLTSPDPAAHPLRITAWIDGPPDGPVAERDRSSMKSEVSSTRPEEIDVRFEDDAEGLLVLGEGFDPGWRVEITDANGETRDGTVHEVDGAVMGCVIPAGATRAVFTYSPRSFTVGMVLSLASLLVIAWAIIRRDTLPPTTMTRN